MKTWDAFYPDVLPVVAPGTPDPAVDRQLLRAAQEFCKRTRAWRVRLDPVVMIDGQTEYDIELPRGSELVRLESANDGGRELSIWRDDPQGCGGYLFLRDGKLFLMSRPDVAGGPVTLDVALQPSNDAEGLEDALFDRYANVIAQGAVSSLNNDASRAVWFDAECASVRARLWRGDSAARPRGMANWF